MTGPRGAWAVPRARSRLWLLPLVAVLACQPVERCGVAGPERLPDGAAGPDAPGPYRLGDVDVVGDTVVFGHAGDLWVVRRAGGDAERLLAARARDQDGRVLPSGRYAPAFSPDGRALAFSAGSDVYVLERATGRIRRLTYHPRGDVVRGWTPSGDTIVFASYRWKRGDNFQLHAVFRDGGTPRQLPLPFAYDGSFSPDGSRFVAELFGGGAALAGWLSYAGGMSRPLKIFERDSWTQVDSVPHAGLQDIEPMWLEDGVYFASARGRKAAPDPSRPGGFDLYRWADDGGCPERITAFRFGGVDAAGADGRTIVLSAEGRLYGYRPGEGALEPIPVRFPDDTLTPVDSMTVPVADWVRDVRFGPVGRIVAEVRGELFLRDPDATAPRRLTRTPGVREHGAVISPDGTRLAYWSDDAGTVLLHLASLEGEGVIDGGGEDGGVRRIPVDGTPGGRRELRWSPDGGRLLFSGEGLGLWIVDAAGRRVRRIARSDFPTQGLWSATWSPDGGLVAYGRASSSGVRAVYLYDVEGDRHHRVSQPLVDARGPVFDRSGRYLWYFASEHAALSVARDIPYWSLLSSTWTRPLLSARLRLAVLDPGAPVPLDAAGRAGSGAAAGESGVVPRDPAGIGGRVVSLPVERRDVVALEPLAPGEVLVRAVEWPHTPGEAAALRTPVHHYSLGSPERLVRVLEHADEIRVSPGGARLLHRVDERWRLSRLHAGGSGAPPVSAPGAGEAGGEPIRVEASSLDWGGDSVTVARMPEWRWIFRKAWDRVRTSYVGAERETLDLASLEEHYAGYLPHLRSREELNELIADMLNHLDLMSHLTVAGGAETPRPTGRWTGRG